MPMNRKERGRARRALSGRGPIIIQCHPFRSIQFPLAAAYYSAMPVRFKVVKEIEDTGKPIQNIYFLEEGMASMTTTFANGMQVEVGMFGFET